MTKNNYSLTITHLYPDFMNIYGDIGNIITLRKRCDWRNIEVYIKRMSFGDTLPEKTDIYFMGGGQDKDQLLVSKDLMSKKKELAQQIESGVCFLAVCGAYQLLGNFFLAGDGTQIKGIGILDIETRAPGTKVKERCIGNVIAELNSKLLPVQKMNLSTIVGFENHSGQTVVHLVLLQNLPPPRNHRF